MTVKQLIDELQRQVDNGRCEQQVHTRHIRPNRDPGAGVEYDEIEHVWLDGEDGVVCVE